MRCYSDGYLARACFLRRTTGTSTGSGALSKGSTTATSATTAGSSHATITSTNAYTDATTSTSSCAIKDRGRRSMGCGYRADDCANRKYAAGGGGRA
jgi:hypothetical protein